MLNTKSFLGGILVLILVIVSLFIIIFDIEFNNNFGISCEIIGFMLLIPHVRLFIIATLEVSMKWSDTNRKRQLFVSWILSDNLKYNMRTWDSKVNSFVFTASVFLILIGLAFQFT